MESLQKNPAGFGFPRNVRIRFIPTLGHSLSASELLAQPALVAARPYPDLTFSLSWSSRFAEPSGSSKGRFEPLVPSLFPSWVVKGSYDHWDPKEMEGA